LGYSILSGNFHRRHPRYAVDSHTDIVVCCSVCSVLQCVAVCCSVLQCVAVCCCVLLCVAVSGATHGNTLQHIATHLIITAPVCYSVLQCVVERCSVLQSVAECCSALQCVAVCGSVLQCLNNT